jgi:hypothetical protein
MYFGHHKQEKQCCLITSGTGGCLSLYMLRADVECDIAVSRMCFWTFKNSHGFRNNIDISRTFE